MRPQHSRRPLYWAAAVALVLLGPACDASGLRPPTKRATRLSLIDIAGPTPLSSKVARPATAFLLPSPLWERSPLGQLRVRAPLDGSLGPGQELRWQEGKRNFPGSETAVLRPPNNEVESGEGLQVRLLQGTTTRDETLVTLEALRPPEAPRVLGGNEELLVQVFGPGRVEWIASEREHGWMPIPQREGLSSPILNFPSLAVGESRSFRRVAPNGATTPWATATGGSLPSIASAEAVRISPEACRDSVFPRLSPSGILSCFPNDEEDPETSQTGALRVNAYHALGQSQTAAPQPLPTPARSGRRQEPVHPPAGRASIASDLSGALLWAGQSFGHWTPWSHGNQRLLHTTDCHRPLGDGRFLAFLREDRIEVNPWGSNRRLQVPARPSRDDAAASLGQGWLAEIEDDPQFPNHQRLILHKLDDLRHGLLTGPSKHLRHPLVSGPWLSFVEDEHLVLLPLGGGEVRRLPSAGAGRRGPPLSLDDWRLDEVPWEGGSVLIARHLPTGLGTRLRFNADFVQARGGAAGLLMWEQRAAGRSGELRLGASPVRLFEEDGTAHGGADLATRPGGHGGNHGWLAAGQVREAELDPGPNGGILDLFVEGDFGEGELQVLRDGTLVARRSWPEAPPETEADTGDDSGPGGWMTLAEITRLPKASPEARRISLRWTAGGKGLRVDAVALRTPIPGNAL